MSASQTVLSQNEAARLLLTTYSIAFGCSIFIAVASFVEHNSRNLLIAGSCAALFALLLLIARLKKIKIAGVLGTGLLLLLVLAAIVTGFGIRDLTFPIFAFIILLANLVLNEQGTQIATAVAWLSAVGVATAEYLGLFRTEFSHQTTASSILIIGVVYLATALTARKLVRAYHRGLSRAQIQEMSYQHIFNATTEAIFLIDPQTTLISDVNESGLLMFGYCREEFLTLSLRQLAGGPQAITQIETVDVAGPSSEPMLFEWTVATYDGSFLPVEVSLSQVRVEGRDILLAVLRDVTESRRMQSKLRESETLQAVGQLAGGIAHDFNNQLTGILANASLLRDRIDDERLAKCADVIVRCSRRSSDLTSQLLAFARRGKHQNVNVDVHDLISEVVGLLEHTIDKRIALETRLSNEALLVQGDPTLLQNALLNLGLNACDAMGSGGTLTFETNRQWVEVTHTGMASALSRGYYACIQVKDTGEGMDEATRRRAFEPFFTTKERGNGMGLAAVYGAVESHQGDISISSSRGAGTTFTILLPLTLSQHDSLSLKAATPLPSFHGTRVLIAEDEEDVATTTALLLQDLGCDVIATKDGQEALSVFSASPEKFDLVLVDHMMPRLSGRETLDEMRKLNPSLRAIITSGYSNDAVIEATNQTVLFLPKPFNEVQLAAIVSMALEQKP